jgi:hypothetical protein
VYGDQMNTSSATISGDATQYPSFAAIDAPTKMKLKSQVDCSCRWGRGFELRSLAGSGAWLS